MSKSKETAPIDELRERTDDLRELVKHAREEDNDAAWVYERVLNNLEGEDQ